MKYDKASPEWRKLFAIFEPRVDETRFCVCACHHTLKRSAGITVTEERLGVLIDPIDHITACSLCVVRHSKAIWQSKQKGAA
jgi:hypothetical protein